MTPQSQKKKKKSLTYKALCVNNSLLGSKQLKFMAKCKSAICSPSEPQRLCGPIRQQLIKNIFTGWIGVCVYKYVSMYS